MNRLRPLLRVLHHICRCPRRVRRQYIVNRRKSNVLGPFPSRCFALGRSNAMSRVLSGCSLNPNRSIRLPSTSATRPTRSRTYASPSTLPSPAQDSLPAGRAHPWPGGLRTRWMTNKVSWGHRIPQFPSTSLAWSHWIRNRPDSALVRRRTSTFTATIQQSNENLPVHQSGQVSSRQQAPRNSTLVVSCVSFEMESAGDSSSVGSVAKATVPGPRNVAPPACRNPQLSGALRAGCDVCES